MYANGIKIKMLLVRLMISGCQPIRSQCKESVLTAFEIYHPGITHRVAFSKSPQKELFQVKD